MMRLAIRNLFQNRMRLLISVGGVALALMLILSLDAIVSWIEQRVAAYIESSGADVWVSQEGVRNLHMAYSSLPADRVDDVAAVPGVESVTPILYVTNVVATGEERTIAYIIGLPEGARAGGPWNLVAGDSDPGPEGAVIDEGIAEKSGIGLGDHVEILGRAFKVVGLSGGTSTFTNSIAFIRGQDFSDLRANPGVVSFVLVRVEGGASAAEVATRIEAEVEGVTAQTREAFAAQERRVVRDMSTDLLTIMNSVGFLIGLAVMGLTVYTSTLLRRGEHGVLKALGAQNRDLYLSVGLQALVSVGLGLVVGLTFTLLLGAIVPQLVSNLGLRVSLPSVGKAAIASVVFAVAAALLPIRQIHRLDPAMVFRGK
jgi:putative ABC transport system permease protein